MQRIHPGYIIIVLIGLIMAGACAPYYIPGGMPTPPLDSTSDIYLGAGIGAGGWQGEAVITPIDHLWMTGHLSYIPFTDSTEVLSPGNAPYMESSLGHLHGEFGLGWYSIINGGRYSLLTGYGSGRSSIALLSNRVTDTTLDWEFAGGNFETYFLQLSAAPFNLDSGGYAGVLLRGEYVQFREFLLDGNPQPLPTALLIEPRLFVAGGTSNPTLFNPGFEFQVGFQFRVGGREEFRFQPLHISLMIRGLLDLL